MTDHLFVEDGGLFSTIQDFGRFGFQRFGISPSGVMDRDATVLANTLVGNPGDTAVIETTLRGPTILVEAESCRFAHAGCDAVITVDSQPVPAWTAFEVRRGSRIVFGAARSGMRGTIAVAGGLAIEPVLGSHSTHTRAGLGGLDGRPLRSGDRLPLAGAGSAGTLLELPDQHRPPIDGAIRVLLGPQDDAFTAEGIAAFLGGTYTVTDKSDRMGCGLDGPRIAHKAGFNIVSDGVVDGSIQVPGNGLPIVLMAERQTTGGYPKTATVITPDLRLLAQRRPGETVRFRAVSEVEAEAAVREAAADLAVRRSSLRPRRSPGQGWTTRELLAVNLISGLA